jgi:hypothetical protein
MLDFKLFLNTSIKEKIQHFERVFSDESFLVDLFWRAKFPHTSHSSAALTARSPDLGAPATTALQYLTSSKTANGEDSVHPLIGGMMSSLKVPIETFN